MWICSAVFLYTDLTACKVFRTNQDLSKKRLPFTPSLEWDETREAPAAWNGVGSELGDLTMQLVPQNSHRPKILIRAHKHKYITLQYTIDCITLFCLTMSYHALQHMTIQCITLPYSIPQHMTIPHDTIQYSTMQFHTQVNTMCSQINEKWMGLKAKEIAAATQT